MFLGVHTNQFTNRKCKGKYGFHFLAESVTVFVSREEDTNTVPRAQRKGGILVVRCEHRVKQEQQGHK